MLTKKIMEQKEAEGKDGRGFDLSEHDGNLILTPI